MKDLKAYGFDQNPYDSCVAHQMTVTLHVDDLKMSLKSELEITKFTVYLVNQGDVLDYLGMDLDYSEKSKGIVKVLQ